MSLAAQVIIRRGLAFVTMTASQTGLNRKLLKLLTNSGISAASAVLSPLRRLLLVAIQM
jgi:hypothetical protein